MSEDLLSINNEDDKLDYESFTNFINEATDRVKKKDADVIFDMGDAYLSEIERKKRINSKKSQPYIEYIINKSDKYDDEYLSDLEYNDIIDIYNQVKYENRGFWVKLMEFFS